MALAGGEPANIENLGRSEDVEATLSGIAEITGAGGRGGAVDYGESGIAEITGAGGRGGSVDCGESGSTLRFLIPIAAMHGGDWVFTGRGRLLERPQSVYEKIFSDCGAVFEHDRNRIRVRGPLPAGLYEMPGDVSSQFVSGLLLASPLMDGECRIALSSPLESAGYAALTVDVMRAFGVSVETVFGADGKTAGWRAPSGARYREAPYGVEGDWSQAAFFLCAGALGADVAVSGLSAKSAQDDRRVTEILEGMGVELRSADGVFSARPDPGGLRGTRIDARDIPDIVPPLAALACFAEGTTHFVGAGRLRLKESDRLAALAGELSKLGADIVETPDGLRVRGKPKLRGGDVSARGDHRIAMALAVASLGCEGPVRLEGAESVGKSYPCFWTDWECNGER